VTNSTPQHPLARRDAATSTTPAAYEGGAATPPPVRHHPEDDRSVVEVLWFHRWKIVGCTMLTLLVGVVYLLVAEPTYKAEAVMLAKVTHDAPKGDATHGDGDMAFASTGAHARAILTTDVLMMAVQRGDLATSPLLAEAATDEERVKLLRSMITAQQGNEGDIINLKIEGSDAEEAARVLNIVLAAYLDHQRLPARIKGRDVFGRPGLVRQPGDLDDAVPLRGAAVEQAADTPAEDIATLRMRVAEIGQSQIETQVALAEAEVLVRDAAKLKNDTPRLIQLIEDAGLDPRAYGVDELTFISSELVATDQELARLPRNYGPNHPMRRPFIDRAEALRNELARTRAEMVKHMNMALAQHRDSLVEQGKSLAATMADHQRMLERSITNATPVVVIEPAQPTLTPIAPVKAKVLGLALVLGVVLGSVVALISDARAVKPEAPAEPHAVTATQQPRIDSVADAELPALTGGSLPVLGVIPTVNSRRRLAGPGFDPSATSIHQVRAILQVRATRHGEQVFAFTSPRRGSGRTSVAVGVASSLAVSGTRTLLVDCDLAGRIARGQGRGRPGRVNGTAGKADAARHTASQTLDSLATEVGLIAQDTSEDLSFPHRETTGVPGMLDGRALDQCVVPSDVANLDLLPGVLASPQHVGKMSDAFVHKMILAAREKYELVVIDTGPTPGSVESMLVCGRADGVVVVTERGETQDAYQRCRASLRLVEAPIIGVVLNRFDTDEPAETDADEAPAEPTQPATRVQSWRRNAAPDAENYGSGVLAAAVFSDSGEDYSQPGKRRTPADVLAGLGDDDDTADTAAQG